MLDLTQAELKRLISYNPRTGVFKWRSSGPGVNESLLAGYRNTQGYRVICLDYVHYLAHRLAFMYMLGYWPRAVVDHRNGRRSDNRWSNLRDVTQTVNMRNCNKATKGAIVRGVSWDSARGRYKAQLCADGVARLNKRFDALSDAIAAYEEARALWHCKAE